MDKRKLDLMIKHIVPGASKYKQIYLGDIVEVKKGSPVLLACCDCGKVHKIAWLSRRSDLLLYFCGGEKETKSLRKQRRFSKK